MGEEKGEISFILLDRKERERERETTLNLCECMTKNLKYIESQGFALKKKREREEMCWDCTSASCFSS